MRKISAKKRETMRYKENYFWGTLFGVEVYFEDNEKTEDKIWEN